MLFSCKQHSKPKHSYKRVEDLTGRFAGQITQFSAQTFCFNLVIVSIPFCIVTNEASEGVLNCVFEDALD